MPGPESTRIDFKPTRPRAHRLVRLGVVLDRRNPPERVRTIARMCELAGIDAVWVHDALPEPEPTGLDTWRALRVAGQETRLTRVGAMLDVATLDWDQLHGLSKAELEGRLEVTLCGTRADAAQIADAAQRLRAAGMPVGIEGDLELAARLADDVLVPGQDLATHLAALAAACAAVGRAPASLGVALRLPVSIGRTETEAQARTADEPIFAGDGHPARSGIFGTLERCQDRVIELAHVGVTDLRCLLPNSPDVHDVIAQLTAMVVGSMDVLQPGAPRSRAPDAPAEWGGRPRFPSA